MDARVRGHDAILRMGLRVVGPVNHPAARRREIQQAFDGTQRAPPDLGSTNTSLAPERRLAATFLSPFIAIQGQWPQLRQVAPWPAVGASMRVLPGAACCIL